MDPQLYQGTAYQVSGWSPLGRTAGWQRDAADCYQKHGTPKQIWVRELTPKAGVQLRAPQLPAAWAGVEAATPPHGSESVGQIRSLMALTRAEIQEFRRPQALAYPVAGRGCLIVLAMAVGVVLGPADLAQFADPPSQAQLRPLGFRRDRRTGRQRSPKKTCCGRVWRGVAAVTLERVLLVWQRPVLGPVPDELVVVDGQKLRHAGVEIVNATDGAGHYLGGLLTPDKTNEIPVARQVLSRLELTGKLVLADALHTQTETAQQILHEPGGDYLLTVQGNPPTLPATLPSLFTPQALSPSAHGAHAAITREHHRGRLELRFLQCLAVTPSQVGFPGARLAARLETHVKRSGKWAREVGYLLRRRTRAQLPAAGWLRLKRKYWVIASRLHHCLDITLHEALSRVRHPNAALVLGLVRRGVRSLSKEAVRRARQAPPKSKCNTKSFRQQLRSARGGRERLPALLEAQHPAVMNLEN